MLFSLHNSRENHEKLKSPKTTGFDKFCKNKTTRFTLKLPDLVEKNQQCQH